MLVSQRVCQNANHFSRGTLQRIPTCSRQWRKASLAGFLGGQKSLVPTGLQDARDIAQKSGYTDYQIKGKQPISAQTGF